MSRVKGIELSFSQIKHIYSALKHLQQCLKPTNKINKIILHSDIIHNILDTCSLCIIRGTFV